MSDLDRNIKELSSIDPNPRGRGGVTELLQRKYKSHVPAPEGYRPVSVMGRNRPRGPQASGNGALISRFLQS